MRYLAPLAAFLMASAARAALPVVPQYPVAATVQVEETQFGIKIAEPYRWLENDVRTDPKVCDWVTAHPGSRFFALWQNKKRDF